MGEGLKRARDAARATQRETASETIKRLVVEISALRRERDELRVNWEGEMKISEAMLRMRDVAKAEATALREALQAVEWVSVGTGSIGCPSCGRWKSEGHATDCRLRAALEGKAKP